MGHGSPLCADLHKTIVNQLKKSNSHCMIAKNFTINGMIKIRFRDSAEITKGIIHCWVCMTFGTLYEKLSCSHDEYSHMGSGVPRKSIQKFYLKTAPYPWKWIFQEDYVRLCSVCATTTWLCGHASVCLPTSWFSVLQQSKKLYFLIFAKYN